MRDMPIYVLTHVEQAIRPSWALDTCDDVVHDGDRVQGHHSWVRTAGGLELDLTRDQFGPTEVVGERRYYPRPQRRPTRCLAQYETLHARVFTALGLEPHEQMSAAMRRPLG
jgi:hypothetical protein